MLTFLVHWRHVQWFSPRETYILIFQIFSKKVLKFLVKYAFFFLHRSERNTIDWKLCKKYSLLLHKCILFIYFFFYVFLKRGCNYQSECGQDSDSSITELQLQTLTLTPNTRITRPFNSTMWIEIIIKPNYLTDLTLSKVTVALY